MAESIYISEESVFEEETKHRTFKIIVEDKTFFVNPSFLAERSPFFDTLLFGDFKEKNEGKAELKEVKSEDFEEFLLVLGADPMKKKKVDVSNISIVLNFSHLWDVSTLYGECISFLDIEYPSVSVDAKTAVEICCVCEKIKTPVSTLKMVAAKLGQFPITVLVENGAEKLLSPRMSAAVFIASKNENGCPCVKPPPLHSRPRCRQHGCNAFRSLETLEITASFCPSHSTEVKAWYSLGESGKLNFVNVNKAVCLENILFPPE